MISELIGRRFKRNKFGLSLWEDRIKEINYSLELVVKPKRLPSMDILSYIDQMKDSGGKYGFKVHVKILGYNTITSYDIDEIVIYND